MDPSRVAEVLVAPAVGGRGRRGSGYRVSDRAVLTAAHVVRGPGPLTVRVRFDAGGPGEWTAPVRVLLAAERADVALLEILDQLRPDRSGPHDRVGAPRGTGRGEPPAEAAAGAATGGTRRTAAAAAVVRGRPEGTGRPIGSVGPTRYAPVPAADLVLPCSAMGFPRFKLRADPMRLLDDGSPAQYRDSCHVAGTVSVLSNLRSGTLELAVPAPLEDPDPARSPWEGMSGAAVWHAGALIGLVSAHHRADGLGRLAAVRVDRWYDLLAPAELELLRRYAALPETLDGPAPSGPLPRQSEGTAPAAAAVSLAGLPDSLPLRELVGLVDALTTLPSVRNAARLELLLGSIMPAVAANSPRDPSLRVDVFAIVRTCLRYCGALDQLLEAVRLMEGDSVGVARMDREVAELARRHC